MRLIGKYPALRRFGLSCLMLVALAACGSDYSVKSKVSFVGISPKAGQIVRDINAQLEQEQEKEQKQTKVSAFQRIENRRWIEENGYYLTTYRKDGYAGPHTLQYVLMAPDGQVFAILEKEKIRFISTKTGEQVFLLNKNCHDGRIYLGACYFSPDGRYFIFSKNRSNLYWIDLKDGFKRQKSGYVKDVCAAFAQELTLCPSQRALEFLPSARLVPLDPFGPFKSFRLRPYESLSPWPPTASGSRLLASGQAGGEGVVHFMYDFITHAVTKIPPLDYKQVGEKIDQYLAGDEIRFEKRSKCGSGSPDCHYEVILSDELLEKGYVTYYMQQLAYLKDRKRENQAYTILMLVVHDIKKQNLTILEIPDYRGIGYGRLSSFVYGDKVAFLGGGYSDDQKSGTKLYQIYQISSTPQKIFSHDFLDGKSPHSPGTEITPVKGSDKLLSVRDAMNEVYFSDVYLKLLRNIKAPFDLRIPKLWNLRTIFSSEQTISADDRSLVGTDRDSNVPSEQSISADGRFLVGINTDSNQIFLIEFPEGEP